MVRMGYDVASVHRQGGARGFEGFRVERNDGGVFYVTRKRHGWEAKQQRSEAASAPKSTPRAAE